MATIVTSFYVATNGKDSWSGTLAAPNAAGTDGPFASLDRAKAAMEASSTAKTTYIRAGEYNLSHTLELTAADSGESWKAYGTEKAVISGGTVVTGWTAEANGLYSAHPTLPTAGSALDVSILTPSTASTPTRLLPAVAGYNASAPYTSGWHTADTTGLDGSTQFHFKTGELTPDQVTAKAQIHLFSDSRWQDSYATIKSIDWTTNTVTLSSPAPYGIAQNSTWQLVADPKAVAAEKNSFAWRADGTLVIDPAAAFSPTTQSVEVATLDRLIHANGANRVTISGLNFINTRTGADAAVSFENSANATITNNRFTGVGEAVRLVNGSDYATVTGNTISGTGSNGIETIHTTHETISNNALNNIGLINQAGNGIVIAASSYDTLDHNSIVGTGRAGISDTSYGNLSSLYNTISNNTITDVARNTGDTGSIYLYNGGASAPVDLHTTVTGNKLMRIGGIDSVDGSLGASGNTSGVYLDDLVNGISVTKNEILNAPQTAVMVHGGSNNTISNNLVTLPDSATYVVNGVSSTGTSTMNWNGDLNFTATASMVSPTKATKLTVTAWGDNAAGVGAHFTVLVDGVSIGQATTTTTSADTARDYVFQTQMSATADHKVSIHYDNDATINGADRNLHVTSLTVNSTTLSPAPTGTFVIFQPGATATAEVQPHNNTVTSNIITTHGTNAPATLDWGATAPVSVWDYNLLDHVANAVLPIVNADQHSSHAAPNFVDPNSLNYHLMSGSPATALGYVDPLGIW